MSKPKQNRLTRKESSAIASEHPSDRKILRAAILNSPELRKELNASTAPIAPSVPVPVPVPVPATLDAKTKLVLTACAKQTRETIQTVKPSLDDRAAFALYVLCAFADSQTRDNVRLDLDTLQKDFNVRVSSDEVIRTL